MCFRLDLKQAENSPRLETRRLILRKFTTNDADALLRILRDKETNTFLPWHPIETIARAREFLQDRFLAYDALPSAYRYAICGKADCVPIGYVILSNHDSRDFGYGLRSEFWHKGIATEAARAVAERARLAGIPYITATHDVKNPRSGEVMKKLGMIYRYTYEERWQPKGLTVKFRMYQLNFDGRNDRVYKGYWNQYPHYIEKNI